MTLGALADQGRLLNVWCNRCGHATAVDPGRLAERLGRDRPIYGIWESLRCVRCGASGKRRGDVFAMASWPNAPMGAGRPD